MELIDIELGIVAIMYLDEKLYCVDLDKLHPELFLYSKNRDMFKRMYEIRKSGKPCDQLALFNSYGFTHDEAVLITAYCELVKYNYMNFPLYYNTLVKLYCERKAKELGANTITFEEYDRSVNKYCKIDTRATFFNTKKDMVQFQNEFDKIVSGVYKNYVTGIGEIDELLGRMMEGTMMVVGGRTSTGKTWLMLQIAWFLATLGNKVLYLSCEMNKTRLMLRLIQLICGVKVELGAGAEFTESSYFGEVKTAIESINKIDLTIAEIHSFEENHINSLIESSGASIVVVDHIQRFNVSGKESRAASFSNIANNLKSIASKKNLLLIAGSQQNRMGEAGNLDSLKESGGISEAADVVLLLEKLEDTYDKTENKIGYKVHISKNRDGMTGEKEMAFSYKFGRFIPKWGKI